MSGSAAENHWFSGIFVCGPRFSKNSSGAIYYGIRLKFPVSLGKPVFLCDSVSHVAIAQQRYLVGIAYEVA
jgi:hypothetical protein